MTPTAASRGTRVVPLIGVALGLAIALVAVSSWRISASSQSLGAEVRFVAAPTGELSVSPAGPLLTARRLSPGNAASGRFELSNLTGKALRVRLRALPSEHALDRALRVEFNAGERRLAAGPLGQLRSFAAGPALSLPAAGRREVELRAELIGEAGREHEGQIVDVTLEFEARPAGARP